MKQRNKNIDVLYSTKIGLLYIIISVLASVIMILLIRDFWYEVDIWIRIFVLAISIAAILSAIAAISWYQLDQEGITKCTCFYKKTFQWHEIKDIYLTTYDTMRYSSGTVECVILSKKIQRPRLTYEAANSFPKRDCAMGFALNSPEMRANIFVPYINKNDFLDFAARRGLKISDL